LPPRLRLAAGDTGAFSHPSRFEILLMRLLLAATALSLAAPLVAQRGGSTNVRTPTMEVGITFHNGCSFKVTYRAIAWAQGMWQKDIKKDNVREFLNQDMKRNPTGSLIASHDLTLGERTVAAGSYKLYFEVDAEMGYHLVLADEAGKELKWELSITETTEMAPRLSLALAAGKGDKEADLGFAFGNMRLTLPLLAEAVAADPQGDKKGDKQEASAGKDGGGPPR
jgi:hypothetical protein